MDRFNESLNDVCAQLFDVGALKFGDFKMKVGINSPVYFDLRVVVSYPSLMDKISTLMLEYMKNVGIQPPLICGVPYTALPFSTIVSIRSNTPMLIRRKEPKKYGTMKLIEGTYSPGQTCVIIEDVVTSGSSILETVQDLRHDGLVITDAIVVINREQGGVLNLENHGIKMHSLLTLSKALNILHSLGKIDEETVKKVKDYIEANQILPNGDPQPTLTRSHQTMSFVERASLATCPLSKRLFNLMDSKKTNLCIAVDLPNSADLLKFVDSVGEYSAVIKTHFDAVLDWCEDTEIGLVELSKKHNFVIMEDRKYSDIGNTVQLQMERIKNWADVVTMHSITGPSFIPFSPKPIFLIAQLSTAGNLISNVYTQATVEMAENNPEIVAGLVCQDSGVIKSPGLIQLTPGVAAQKGGDSLGQQYVTPEDAVLIKGGDLIVVGRAITAATNPQVAAKELRDKLWNAYEKRVGSMS